ncbi:MAG: DUF3160 domain-containing protein [Anaerolineales bacterium]|nr:DUF3160 domain-containing protein [Anaerolineales bacterium]
MEVKIKFGSILRFVLATAFFVSACKLAGALVAPSTTGEVVSETPAAATITAPAEITGTAMQTVAPVSSGPRFAVFEEAPGDVSPQIKHEKIADDLNNVQNPFALSPAQIEHLARDGFVITPGKEKEFFALYEKARYDNTPIFATSDALLHSYHLLFDKVLRTAESERFIPLLRSFNRALLGEADSQYQRLIGSRWEDAARRTVAYLGVGSLLLDAQATVPPYVKDLVSQEIALIQASNGIQPSPIFPGLAFGEDYTQYIPRGHYTRSEELKAYFRSMMWYGRMTFRLKSENIEAGRAETRSALLLMQALRNAQVNGKPAMEAWAELYAPTVFFVGRSDDLTVTQYNDVMDMVYGRNADLSIVANDNKLDQFIDLAYQLPPPRILGIVISDTEDEQQATKGLRLMGQRFVPDAYIFRQLIYRNVGTPVNRRGLPRGLDVLAAMGSERAYQHLEAMGDTRYENYPQQMEKVRSWLSGLSVDEWTETLYNTWLYSFFPLLQTPTEGYPAFMRSSAWLDKQLNTALGSWAELKHDTILYAKQVYAEMGGGPPPPPPLPPRGYVEPVPVFYARLAALTAMTRTGLDERGLLNETDRESLIKLEDLARSFQVIAEKELRGQPLTDDEYERIRYFGGELEDIVMRSADVESAGDAIGNPVFMAEDQQAAVIADVATDPDPTGTGAGGAVVLQVGVGRINEIHAVVPLVNQDGSVQLQVAKGGVFSYYEFPWPADDRLTDEKWRTMLEQGQAPPMQDWVNSFFVAEGENSPWRDAVRQFQDQVTLMYWSPQDAVNSFDQATEWYRPEITQLVSQKQYVGHQLMSVDFRSFDKQNERTVVVTVREVWQDTLHSFTGDYPNYDEPAVAVRGPYTLDVTYTLVQVPEQSGFVWQVKLAIYAHQPPAW